MNRLRLVGVTLCVLLTAAPLASARDGWPGCRWGYAYDPMAQGYVPACFSRPADNAAALKPAGLAKIAPVEEFVPCGFDGYDPMVHGYLPACFSQPFPTAKAASKSAGLAAPAPAVIPEQGWPGCPWGAAYDPMAHGYVPACFYRPADNAAALKPAGLAKLAPVEAFVPCGFGERLDPLALACQH